MSFTRSLAKSDGELAALVRAETQRQRFAINLIASENCASKAVLEALGTPLQNKYSEGFPGQRYYGGNEIIDKIENLAIERAKALYRLGDDWGVVVQALSGSPANFSLYIGLLPPGARALGLKLSAGGHLSHGFALPTKKVNFTSRIWNWEHFEHDAELKFDYERIDAQVRRFRPRLVMVGYSAYPGHFDYKRLRQSCDAVGAYLVADMAHIAGLVAARVAPDPFPHCHAVTTTTHKTLRGPRGALIFARTAGGKNAPFARISEAIFPGFQGGPHNHTIAGIAAALKEAQSPHFVEYQKRVLANARTLSDELARRGVAIVSGGTQNHLLLADVRGLGLNGAEADYALNRLGIIVNKNTLLGDASAQRPSAIRLGSPAMTTRGCGTAEFAQIAAFVRRGLALGAAATADRKSETFKAKFDAFVEESAEAKKLESEIRTFCEKLDFYDLNSDFAFKH